MATAKQAEFRQFERMYAQVRKANKEERMNGVGLLTPKLLKEHIDSGTDLVLAYGRKGATVSYTVDDLKRMAESMRRSKANNKASLKGVPLLQLEHNSDPKDVERSKQVRAATLYKFSGNTLSFQVTASGKNGKKHHQVRVRLEEWYDHLTDPASWNAAAKAVAVGRISFDCTCGRHQYWYRYLATIGNFALAPLEKDFPKIRNPQLKGCCCKHVLKVLSLLKAGTVHSLIAKELEKQAGAAGYVDKKQARYLTPTELEKAKRARGSVKDTQEAVKAYREFNRAKKAFAKKVGNAEMKQRVKSLENELKVQKAKEKALRARAEAVDRRRKQDAIAHNLLGFLDAMDAMDVPRDVALGKFAAKNNIGREELQSIIEAYKI